MNNIYQTIISQYANSPTLVRLIENINAYLDQTQNLVGSTEADLYVETGYWDALYCLPILKERGFYNYIWNVETAQGFGLDILGRIVGASRFIVILTPQEYFGFNEGAGYEPFDQAIFYNGASSTDLYALSDDAYRVLILVKAMANISATTAPALNHLLQALFVGRGRCYVNDIGGMAMTYTFEFPLQPYEAAILSAGKVLPHPAGVQAFINVIDTQGTFGFAEAGPLSQPFGQGTFISSGATYAVQ